MKLESDKKKQEEEEEEEESAALVHGRRVDGLQWWLLWRYSGPALLAPHPPDRHRHVPAHVRE